jgi:hypothetical protein
VIDKEKKWEERSRRKYLRREEISAGRIVLLSGVPEEWWWLNTKYDGF